MRLPSRWSNRISRTVDPRTNFQRHRVRSQPVGLHDVASRRRRQRRPGHLVVAIPRIQPRKKRERNRRLMTRTVGAGNANLRPYWTLTKRCPNGCRGAVSDLITPCRTSLLLHPGIQSSCLSGLRVWAGSCERYLCLIQKPLLALSLHHLCSRW